MKTYNELCPNCGTWNYDLRLEETGGIYECECCKRIIRVGAYNLDLPNVPHFDLGNPKDVKRLTAFANEQDNARVMLRKIRATK